MVLSCDDSLDVQRDGVAVGSPVAPLLANIFMSHLEWLLPKRLQNTFKFDVVQKLLKIFVLWNE